MSISYEELGLPQYEGKAYESLIKFGKATAAKISAESGVPYGRVYDVLESLIRRGLAKVLPGKTKEFVPTDPEELLKLVQNKKEVLEVAATEIRRLKQVYELAVNEPVILSYGKRNFYKMVKEMKTSKIYNYTIRYTAKPKPEWIREQKQKIKNGLDSRNLTRYDEETKRDVLTWVKETGPRWRAIENEGVAMTIRDNKEVLIALIKSNVTMLIRDTSFVKLMKNLFIAKWENAPKIITK